MSSSAINPNSKDQATVALALDIGTSSIRASLYDNYGNELTGTTVKLEREFRTERNNGSETDANEVIDQVERAIDGALASPAFAAAKIELVAVSCFWHSLVGIDQEGNAVTPLYGWADTRSAEMVGELQRSFDEREIHARNGCRFHSSYWPAKLLWLRRHNPNAYRASTQWVSLSELLMQRIFGKTLITVSMASGTGLFNLRNCVWDEELLSYLDISVEQLPNLATSNESFSGLVSDYSRRWPQLRHARWYPAIGDGAANNIGSGCVTRERAAMMIGTSGAMRVMWSDSVPETIPEELWCYRVDHNRVIVGGALSDGGGLFAWMKDSVKLDGNDEDIEQALGDMLPDEHGLTLLPFWAGERSTGWHASASGTIVGVKQSTLPIEILRASMEAIAYRFALIDASLDQVASQTAVIASGNALISSPVWTQILADVLGRPVTLSDVREASSCGAVLLAFEMEGKIKDIADVPVPLARTFEPDIKRHARYREGLERQQELYARLITQA